MIFTSYVSQYEAEIILNIIFVVEYATDIIPKLINVQKLRTLFTIIKNVSKHIKFV